MESSFHRNPTQRSLSSNGARQRASPQVATRNIRRTAIGENTELSNSMDVSSNSINGGSEYHQHQRQRYPSPTNDYLDHSNSNHRIPYGMLNPGPSSSPYYNAKDNNKSSFYPRWIRKITQSGSSGISSPYANYHYYGGNGRAQTTTTTSMAVLLGFCIICILAMAVYQHDRMLQEALHMKEQEVEHHYHHALALEQRVSTLRTQTVELEDKIVELEHHHLHYKGAEDINDKSSNDEGMSIETQRKMIHLEHSNLKMQHDVQAMSKRMVKEK